MSKVIMYFTADWCQPCQAIKPQFMELSKEYPDMSFNKIDADLNRDKIEDFNVQSLPTFVFLHEGKEVFRFSGKDVPQLKEKTERLHQL